MLMYNVAIYPPLVGRDHWIMSIVDISWFVQGTTLKEIYELYLTIVVNQIPDAIVRLYVESHNVQRLGSETDWIQAILKYD